MKTKLPLFLILVLICSVLVSAQDVIFRHNGEIIKTKMLNQNESSISYQLYDNKDSLTHYISTSVIDSILYQSGTKDIFTIIEDSPPQTFKPVYLHHLIGFDLADILLYQALGVSYEFLPGNAHIGFKVSHEEWDGYLPQSEESYEKFTNWNLRIGVNYYFFPQRTFRMSTGINYIFSHEKSYDYSASLTTIEDLHNFDFSIYGFYNLSKQIAINIGYNFPISLGKYRNSNFYALKCELMFNF